MPNISDNLADRLTSHDVDVMRFEAGLRRRVLREMRKLEADLIAQLEAIDVAGPTRVSDRQIRLQKLLDQTRGTIRTRFRNAKTMTNGQLRELAKLEDKATRQILNGTIKAEVATVALPPDVVREIVSKENIIQGAPSSRWWSRQAGGVRQRFEDQVRQGLLANETNSTIARRVRDEVMSVNRNQSEALVRTSVQNVSNAARFKTYERNDDVIKGVQALVTLDTRTTDICKARSGAAWDLKTGRPLPESRTNEDFPGHPPWHWGCRTTLVPVLKSWEELRRESGGTRRTKLGKKMDEIPESTQASMDGQVAADLTYERWLKNQTKERQIEALGRQKWELWKKNEISLRALIDQSGRPLTVQQLRKLTEQRIGKLTKTPARREVPAKRRA